MDELPFVTVIVIVAVSFVIGTMEFGVMVTVAEDAVGVAETSTVENASRLSDFKEIPVIGTAIVPASTRRIDLSVAS